MLYTWIYIHLQAQRPISRLQSDDNRAERPPTPSPPWSLCVCERRRGVRGGGGGRRGDREDCGEPWWLLIRSVIGAVR